MRMIWQTLTLSSLVLSSTALTGVKAIANGLPIDSTSNSSKSISTEKSTRQTPANQQLVASDRDNSQTILDRINVYSSDIDSNNVDHDNSLSQVTSVSQFTDVQPTDWAFQALQSLVERYGCIAGYPDSTYRGNRAISRYEFAAGLNACLNRINELIASGTANLASKQDLETIQRLQEDFKSELATLRGRVDALETRTAYLESHQFSTTTKLVGEAIFAITANLSNNTITNSAGNSSKNG